MNKQDAIEWAGGVKNLARLLKVWPQAIYKWGDTVPPHHAATLHIVSGGRLLFDAKNYANMEDIKNG